VVNRAARLTDMAHGGQIACSHPTADLARDVVAKGVSLVDLGEYRLRDLSRSERVFQVNAPGLQGQFGPLRSVEAFPGNLPLPVSSLIGREREIDRTIEALAEARVVTLTGVGGGGGGVGQRGGVGGVGKTRLAHQVAALAMTDFEDGAWLVELAPVRDAD